MHGRLALWGALPTTAGALIRERITDALRGAGCRDGEGGQFSEDDERLSPRDWTRLLVDPARLRSHLEDRAEGAVRQIRVTGTLDRRLVMIQRHDGRWVAADLSGRSHSSRAWPGWTEGQLTIEHPSEWLSAADLSRVAMRRLSRPNVLLAALYHRETFPLPRFALGLHDVARAARSTLTGTVALADMQLGTTLDDLLDWVCSRPLDILGVSATFGQHDLMVGLLDTAYALSQPPLVVVGGSLSARNEALLLERYPALLVARGAGEATIAGLMGYWHGELEIGQVPGLGYMGAAPGGAMAVGRRHTAIPPARDAIGDMTPELDLLPATFEHHGVAQIESSRGCTNFCSFCPRGHKGTWNGARPAALPWLLDEMRQVFDCYPDTSRTLYLVDEEFIGGEGDAVARAIEVAGLLEGAGFAWESSCRIDQVVRPDRDHGWHVNRARMWRHLLGRGLRRMLFGVESGVDSILARFAKETTGKQNALAIRTLSALGVPSRFTYITFDHLMTLEELKATYAFQGRTDLLLQPQPGLPAEAIVDGVRHEGFVSAVSTGLPLYSGISYMLVSMECLTGAAYTRRVQEAGLAGVVDPSMGRVQARFADWRIGVASSWAQRWVDRSFTLDYTLKSLEKVLDGSRRGMVRDGRLVLKDASYDILGAMIRGIDSWPSRPGPGLEEALSAAVRDLLDTRFAALKDDMAVTVDWVCVALGGERSQSLRREHQRWERSAGWRLINGSESCAS